VNVINTTKDGSSQLTSEGIPDTVFNLGAFGAIDRDTLLAIDGFTGNEVLGDQKIFLTAGNEDTFMSVGFDNDLGSSSGSATGTATATTGCSTSSTTTAKTATAST
jgi:hypothetical protein